MLIRIYASLGIVIAVFILLVGGCTFSWSPSWLEFAGSQAFFSFQNPVLFQFYGVIRDNHILKGSFAAPSMGSLHLVLGRSIDNELLIL